MKRIPMRKIRDVLRLSAEGLSTRQIAASLAIGRTTLRGYLDRAAELGLSWPLPPEMSDTDLERRLFDRAYQNTQRVAAGVCQRCCPPISCGVSDFRDADFGFWVKPDGSGGLPVAGFA